MRKSGVVLFCSELLLVGAMGCATLNLEPEATPGQVDSAFRHAQRRAEHCAERCRGRKPHRVHVLVHDGVEGSLIQISVPMWLVRMALRFAGADDSLEIEGVELDWRDVLQRGSGIYLSMDAEENHILVWLD